MTRVEMTGVEVTGVEMTGVEMMGVEMMGVRMTGATARVSLVTRLRFGVSLWLAARLLPSRVARKPFQRVLRLAEPSAIRFRGLPPDYIAKRILQTTRKPWLMRDRRCLRQGLLGCRFLAEAGYAPELHFGINPSSIGTPRLAAHCWVCINGTPVLNDRVNDMVTILVHRVTAEAKAK
jgi:hypothetical protein